jgi:tyrosyl-tRNA synthetase
LHGVEAATAAEITANTVFGSGSVTAPIPQISGTGPTGSSLPTLTLSSSELSDGISIVQLFVRSGLAKSGKEAKRLIAENGARMDDAPLTNAGLMIDAGALASPIKLSAGKKRHALVQLDG